MSASSLRPTLQGAAQVPALRQFTFQRNLDNKEAIKDKMTWGVVVRATGMSQWGLTGAGEPRGLHTPLGQSPAPPAGPLAERSWANDVGLSLGFIIQEMEVSLP